MSAKSTRRAVLAGAAAIPALALPATAAQPDPIFAAIEKHRAAHIVAMETGRVVSGTPDEAPSYVVAEKKDREARTKAHEAAYALLDLRPATMAGILALLEYVEEFNAGNVWLESTRGLDRLAQWRSSAVDWPEMIEDESSEIDMFGYKLLANVREALKALAA
jgi:hypothetical protein